MNDKERADLQDPDSWDYERAIELPASKKPRAVVSVAFAREDFERVAMAARRDGKKISEFVRDAAIGQVASPGARATLMVSSAGAGSLIVTGGFGPMTRARVLVTSEEIIKSGQFMVA
jgi:hypothetical protein